jgi:transketolase
MNRTLKLKELRVFAEEIRLLTLKEFAYTGFGHVGGAMSIIELWPFSTGRR